MDFLQDAEGDGDEEDDEMDIFEIYEDSAELDMPYDLIAEIEKEEAAALANKMPSAASLNKVEIDKAVVRWRKHDKDVGSAEVQVAIAHERIRFLTQHILQNKHDMSAKRGLQAIVTQRRKFLNFLYLNDRKKAIEMVTELGIRFRPPGMAWDKKTKYAAFKNTKTSFKKKKSVKTAV